MEKKKGLKVQMPVFLITTTNEFFGQEKYLIPGGASRIIQI